MILSWKQTNYLHSDASKKEILGLPPSSSTGKHILVFLKETSNVQILSLPIIELSKKIVWNYGKIFRTWAERVRSDA